MRRIIFAVGVIVLWGAAVLPAVAGKETCKQCKFAKCIKNTIKQKEALAAAYATLANKWDKFWVRVEGENRVPVNSIDLESLDMTSRGPTLANLARDYKQFEKDESEMVARIGAPADCGFGDADVEMMTNIIACEINLDKAKQAEQAMPCKELHDIAFRHEVLHLEACQKRKGEKIIPPVRLTPAGKAREEARAYTREITELKALVLEADCHGELEYQAPITLNMQPLLKYQIFSTARISFKIDDNTKKITGGGTQTLTLKQISSGECTATSSQSEYEWTVSGQEENGYLQFKFSPRGGATIPGIRMQCRIAGGQGYGMSLPMNFNIGDVRIEKKDGATREMDISRISDGRATGKAITTLYLYKK